MDTEADQIVNATFERLNSEVRDGQANQAPPQVKQALAKFMNTPDPGKGYRLLKEGETLRAGDEFLPKKPNDAQWSTIAQERDGCEQALDAFYRRRIEDRWIPLSERLPDKWPCELYGRRHGIQLKPHWGVVSGIEKDGVTESTNDLNEFTHWKPLQLSDPPEAQVSEDEKAFDVWWGRGGQIIVKPDGKSYTTHTARNAWLAALEYARGKKSP